MKKITKYLLALSVTLMIAIKADTISTPIDSIVERIVQMQPDEFGSVRSMIETVPPIYTHELAQDILKLSPDEIKLLAQKLAERWNKGTALPSIWEQLLQSWPQTLTSFYHSFIHALIICGENEIETFVLEHVDAEKAGKLLCNCYNESIWTYVVIHKETNSLTLIGSKENVTKIKNFLKKDIDYPLYQYKN